MKDGFRLFLMTCWAGSCAFEGRGKSYEEKKRVVWWSLRVCGGMGGMGQGFSMGSSKSGKRGFVYFVTFLGLRGCMMV